MTDYLDAWKVSEKSFPHDGGASNVLAYCVRYAVLAPSPYNTQPWYFRIKDNVLSLYADRRYGLPVIDPDDREMTICCGAALFNLRLAIRYFGYKETTELAPDPENEDLLARVKLGPRREDVIDDGSKLLFKAIPKRHMNRGAFVDREVSDSVLNTLQVAASKEGAWLHLCGQAERRVITRLISEADHIQTGSKNFRRELATWADPRRKYSGDGMPGSGLSYSEIMGNLAPTVLRRFEAEGHQAANDRQLEEGAPVIAVLGSKTGGAAERLYAGQGLMRILLSAEMEGLSVSTLNQPCQVPELRLRLHDELEHPGRAHMILRFGYASGKARLTPRRELSSFIEFEGKAGFIAEGISYNDGKAGKVSFMKRLLRNWR